MKGKPETSIFTFYFDMMKYLGFWIIETNDPLKRLLYFLYSCGVRVWVLFISYMGVLDFIASFPKFDKISYNISINLLINGTFVKNLQILHKSKRISSLHKKLHRDVETCKDTEELEIYADAVADLKIITRLFYFYLFWLYPTWLVLSYFSEYWGERHLPLPAKWPGDVDINDFNIFVYILIFHACFSTFFLFFFIAMDISMFGLLVEIHREYRFLLKNINHFGALCEVLYSEGNTGNRKSDKSGEINVYLKKAKVRRMLRAIIIRQKELFSFTEDFEYGYNISMFIHIFFGGILLCFNGVQAMIVSFEFSENMAYQFGYLLSILTDMLYLCWLTNRISTKCSEVGTAFYTTPWYKMEVDIQKDISLVILRSRKPPRITSGNFVELNLQTFMAMLKNIYSWLALFRQVVIK